MALLRVTMLFQVTTNPDDPSSAASHSGGWSESMWQNNGTPLLPAVYKKLCQTRATLLPKQATIVGIRQGIYNLVGNKLLPQGTSGAKFLTPGNTAYTTDLPQCSLEVSGLGAGVPNSNRFRLGCLPDEQITNGEYQPTVGYKGLVTTYLRNLSPFGNPAMGGPWWFVGRNTFPPSVRVASLVPLGGVTLDATLVTLADTTAGVGDYIRFHRVYDDSNNPVKGTYLVKAVPAVNTYTLTGIPQQKVSKPSGLCRKDELTPVAYLEVNVSRAVVKKIGRPFQQYRGRASNRTPA